MKSSNKKPEYFSCLAIDMGAGSIRVIRADFAEQLTLHEIHRFKNTIEIIDGHERWNLNLIEEQLFIGIQKAGKNSPYPILSISADSWGVDYVLLDKSGTPIEFPVAYRDKRTEGMMEKLDVLIPKLKIFEKTGINFYLFNTLYQLFSQKGDEIFNSSSQLLLMANYINYFLSGVAKNEMTLASTTQLLNSTTKNWDTDLLKMIGISSEMIGKPVSAGEILGPVKTIFNLPLAKVITGPSHDTAAAVESIPFNNPNFAFISTGTWCVLGYKSTTQLTTQKALDFGLTNEITADGNFRILKNIMGLWLIEKLKDALDPEMKYETIQQLAIDSDSSEYLVDVTDNLFYNPENMKIAFDQYFEKKGYLPFQNWGQYFRCAYESLAHAFKTGLNEMETLRNQKFEVLHMIGGGIQSTLLCQLTANKTGLPVHAGPIEGASIGNAIWQAIGLGKLEIHEVSDIIRNSFDVKIYHPKNH